MSKYWHEILKDGFDWAVKTKQPSYFIGVLKALMFPRKYKAWLDREVSRIYRKYKKKGLAFYKDFEGLPKLNDNV